MQLKKEIYTKDVFPTKIDASKNPLMNVIDSFTKKGGRIEGKGSFGLVLSHPRWRFVFKIFKKDIPYLKFVRYAIKNSSSAFPIFYDIPRKIKTSVKTFETIYGVKMEPLKPISYNTFLDVEYYLSYYVPNYRQKLTWEMSNKLNAIEETYPNIKEVQKAYVLLKAEIGKNVRFGETDIHSRNIMMRENNEIVLADPLYSFRSGLSKMI